MIQLPNQTLTPQQLMDVALRVLGVIGAVLVGAGGLAGFFLKRYWDLRDKRQDQEWREREKQQERDWRAREQELQAREAERAAREESRARFRDVLLESLKWFEGKTQNRSIGISVVEASWEQYPELRQIWRGVLVNQAVYLLTASEQGDKRPELSNLQRIMALLAREAESIDPVSRASLRNALHERMGQLGGERPTGKGLQVEHSDLAEWWEKCGFNWWP